MSMLDQVRRLARWNVWANRLVGESLRKAGGEPPSALAAYQHVFEAELTWLRRMANDGKPGLPLWGPATLEQAEAWSDEAATRLRAIHESADEAFLSSTFEYANSSGRRFSDRVEEPLLHLFLHSQQYRGEAAAFLNAAGHRVPDFDFIFWLRSGEPV